MIDQVGPLTVLPRGREPQYREVYSNMSQTNIGAFDITLLFQKRTEISPGQQGILDCVAVTFSPQHFKALVRSLQETLKGYEDAFGKLSIADSDTAPQTSAEQIAEAVKSAREPGGLLNPSPIEPLRPEKRSRGASREKAP